MPKIVVDFKEHNKDNVTSNPFKRKSKKRSQSEACPVGLLIDTCIGIR
jgi:hypothetical protein